MEIILKYFADFTDQQLQQLRSLEHLYREWNSRINLISRKDIESLYEKHVLHSLAIAAVFNFPDGTGIIDIGTGGGFPGIPLAIFFPEVNFHLVDSIAKKIKVVESIASELGLKNVTCLHARAEEIKNRKFDFAVSRAVAPLKELWKWSRPILKKGQQSVAEGKKLQSESDLRNPSPVIGLPQLLQYSNLPAPGLICLKGGDMTKEIEESGTRPLLIEVFEIFAEEYFKKKYIIYVPY